MAKLRKLTNVCLVHHMEFVYLVREQNQPAHQKMGWSWSGPAQVRHKPACTGLDLGWVLDPWDGPEPFLKILAAPNIFNINRFILTTGMELTFMVWAESIGIDCRSYIN